jgi:hypothetical protein
MDDLNPVMASFEFVNDVTLNGIVGKSGVSYAEFAADLNINAKNTKMLLGLIL